MTELKLTKYEIENVAEAMVRDAIEGLDFMAVTEYLEDEGLDGEEADVLKVLESIQHSAVSPGAV